MSKKAIFIKIRFNVFVLWYFVALSAKIIDMKKIELVTADNKELHIVPEDRILEVGDVDGTTTVAYVCVIKVKQTIDEILDEVSEGMAKKIRWVRQC